MALDLTKSIRGRPFLTKWLMNFGTKQKDGDQHFFDRRGAGVIRTYEIKTPSGEIVKIRGIADSGPGMGGGSSMVISRPASENYVNPAKAMEAYKNWTYAAVRAIAEEIGGIEWRMLKKSTTGDQVELDTHEVLDLLEAVNDFQTGPEFRHTLTAHLELTGNAYILLLNKAGEPVASAEEKPASIFLLNPGEVEIKLDKTKYPYRIAKYKHTCEGKERMYDAYQIVQIKYPNPLNAYSGIGTVQGSAEWIDNDNASTEFLRQFFKNGAQIGVTFETDMTSEEQLHELRDSFNEQHQGVSNSFKAMFLPKGVTPSKTDVTFDKIGFDQISDTNRDKILAGFRVSKTILGTAESDTNRSTAETADYVFARRTIKPKMQLICSYLNEFLVPRFGDDLTLSFTDPVPEDLEAKTAEMKNSIGAQPVMTVNEAREQYMNLDPIEGGDAIMMPNNYIPASQAGQAQPNMDPTMLAAKKAVKRPRAKLGYVPSRRTTGKTQAARNAETRKELTQSVTDKILQIVTSIKKKGIKDMTDKEYDDVILKEKRNRTIEYSKQIEAELVRLNDKQKQEVLNKLDHEMKGQVKALDASKLFDLDNWISITVNALKPVVNALFAKEADHALNLVDKPGLDVAGTPTAQTAIDKALNLMAKSYHENTIDLLGAKLTEGLEQGFSAQKLGDLVSDIYAFKNQYAAERVALTESNRIANDASKMAWKDSGVVTEVKWVTAENDTVCPFCDEMDGKTIDIEDNFFDKGDGMSVDSQSLDFDYSAVGGPPLHPNCHCGIRPIVDTSIEASLSPDDSVQKDVEDAIIKINKLAHVKE